MATTLELAQMSSAVYARRPINQTPIPPGWPCGRIRCDTAAIGGDLAYRYNRFGTLSDISFTPAQSILGNAGFVTSAQTLLGTGSLQDSTPRLS
jgi:hypothetical protein